MKLFLSSFRLGDDSGRLADLMGSHDRVAFVPNALDLLDAPIRETVIERGLQDLQKIGCDPVVVDLRTFFDKDTRQGTFTKLDGCFVAGGNVFVLRRAMRQSGLDTFLQERRSDSDFLYAGYSAGACAAGSTLKGLHLVDDSEPIPDGYQSDTVWEGLGLIDYAVVPHYQSEHPESEAMNDVVRYCEAEGITYRTLKDGEVVVREDQDQNTQQN